MEERLSQLERFEKARYRRKKIYWERFYFALVMMCGRGCEEEWRISHEELERIQNEGLLPIPERY